MSERAHSGYNCAHCGNERHCGNYGVPADPYAVRLEPGERVVREGWGLWSSDYGYYSMSQHLRVSEATKAELFDSASMARYAWARTLNDELVHITVIRTPERRELVEVECDGWVNENPRDGKFNPWMPISHESGWRPIRIIPGHERAVVRRLVPGPEVETP